MPRHCPSSFGVIFDCWFHCSGKCRVLPHKSGRVGQSLPHCISQCYCLSAPQQFGCRMFHNSEESVGNYSSEEPDKVNCPTCAPLLKQKDMSVGVGFDAEDLNRYSPRDRVVPWFMLKKKLEFACCEMQCGIVMLLG